MNRAALVIMAAGLGSRYGGSKQIEGMGPNGEIIMEYSIMDAIRAGFTKAVLIIKPNMLERMKQICEEKYADRIDIRYVFQDFSSIPRPVPEARVKPFGTVHAVLCAASEVQEPFAVINADDYYGVDPYRRMYEFLTEACTPRRAAMMGYRLKNTVSASGTVTRGLCREENGTLAGVREVHKIALEPDGTIASVEDGEERQVLNPDSLVSMNFWGFGAEIFESMKQRFEQFLDNAAPDDLRSEYLLPVFVDDLLKAGELSVDILPTAAKWFGVTYQEDREGVVRAFADLHGQNVYPL